MKGVELIAAVRKELRQQGLSATNYQVAEYLGMTEQGLYRMRDNDDIKPYVVVRMLKRTRTNSTENYAKNAIRPIVEYFPISRALSKQNARYEVFNTDDGNGEDHPYRLGVRKELECHFGVYVFYDSRGKALYVGNTQKQTLWTEINLAFNRPRGHLQKIKRVEHPSQRRDFRNYDEMRRQIKETNVHLYDIAHYFSAYKVAKGLVRHVETIMIRAFANDLLNGRMEQFS